jgi:hypothetical protein
MARMGRRLDDDRHKRNPTVWHAAPGVHRLGKFPCCRALAA